GAGKHAGEHRRAGGKLLDCLEWMEPSLVLRRRFSNRERPTEAQLNTLQGIGDGLEFGPMNEPAVSFERRQNRRRRTREMRVHAGRETQHRPPEQSVLRGGCTMLDPRCEELLVEASSGG